MSYALDRIFLTMGKIIGRINIPGIASAVMSHLFDSVHHRVAHIYIRRSHINLSAQSHGSLVDSPQLHLLKQRQALFSRSFAIGAVFAHLGKSAAELTHLFGVKLTDISFAFANQILRPAIQLTKIIRGKLGLTRPIKTKPFNVFDNCLNIFVIFFFRVGIIKAQIAGSAKLLGKAEIQADRFGMAYMQIAIWLWWKSGNYRFNTASLKVGINYLLNKIARFFDISHLNKSGGNKVARL